MDKVVDLTFYKGKRVFLTGHTGFKGSWLCQVLLMAGAEVFGYSLQPPTSPSLYDLLQLGGQHPSETADVRDLPKLMACMQRFRPEIVLHMAAQPLVRLSYTEPVSTFETNVMGTVHVLEAVRCCPSVRSFLNITTDKVYHNREWCYGYREVDELNGYDPYSNSKSCSELVTGSYYNAFFKHTDVAVSTARAGNVIGGGDFAEDRILPDCVRAMQRRTPIVLRNPYSIRPYQHVLDPLFAYLLIAREQYCSKVLEGAYNVGPDERDCVTTGELADLFCAVFGDGARWENRHDGGPHEAGFLKLDCSKLKSTLGWQPLWNIETAVQQTVAWSKVYLSEVDVRDITRCQIEAYASDACRK